ncbi:hypothetical protein COU58_02815 [Candidatus Pacearchaeota archaeon CG10_big_fil_rev_8_21_14_0_10_32_42]|nr:MAG: hypothetical protein COU58_02815 [Candidatus Pacearchaeota archaeon CG10_big_fil_rev_8_21_14_0_10_32_42]
MIRLVAFNLTRITAEKFSSKFSELKIETSINLDLIEENKEIPKKDKIKYLNVLFKYNINYSDKIAKIELGGKIILAMEEELAEEILKNWKKKDFKDEIRVSLFNSILIKSNIKAIQIEEELGLPPHFKLPSLTISKKE